MPHPRKLNREQVLHIRSRELTQRQFVKKYGVGRSTIEEIQAWRRYADVRRPGDPMTVAWLKKILADHPDNGLIDPDTLSIDIIGVME